MVVVVAAGHALAGKAKPSWADLAAIPCVLPPPWASLRVKIEQQFFKHGLEPPQDVVETASFLGLTVFLQQRGAAGFLAQSVAKHFESQGILKVLRLKVAIELPPVGLITLRGRQLTATTQQLIACFRQANSDL
jgi:DNA-binding transcriptional LysR family regulator